MNKLNRLYLVGMMILSLLGATQSFAQTEAFEDEPDIVHAWASGSSEMGAINTALKNYGLKDNPNYEQIGEWRTKQACFKEPRFPGKIFCFWNAWGDFKRVQTLE